MFLRTLNLLFNYLNIFGGVIHVTKRPHKIRVYLKFYIMVRGTGLILKEKYSMIFNLLSIHIPVYYTFPKIFSFPHVSEKDIYVRSDMKKKRFHQKLNITKNKTDFKSLNFSFACCC